jgi:hypothetical protein
MYEDSDDKDDDSDHQKLGRIHTMWQQTWSSFLVLRTTGSEHVPSHITTPFLGVAASLLSVFVKQMNNNRYSGQFMGKFPAVTELSNQEVGKNFCC